MIIGRSSCPFCSVDALVFQLKINKSSPYILCLVNNTYSKVWFWWDGGFQVIINTVKSGAGGIQRLH